MSGPYLNLALASESLLACKIQALIRLSCDSHERPWGRPILKEKVLRFICIKKEILIHGTRMAQAILILLQG